MTCPCGRPITESQDTALRLVDGEMVTVHRACQEFTLEKKEEVPSDPAP